MGFAFYPDDGAKLRDAFQKQFPEYIAQVEPERVVGVQHINVRLLQNRWTIAQNTFEAALHLDSCVISAELSVREEYKNQGIGQRMMQAKIEWANKQHYTLLATIRDHNEVQKHILTKFDWQYVGADLWVYIPVKE